MRKNLFRSALAAIIICVFASNVFSAEKLVVVTEQYVPYEYVQNGKWVGIDIETVNEMGKRAGIDIVIQEYPWVRCLKMMEDGSADAIISLIKSPEREAYLTYPEVNISEERNVIFAKNSFAKKLTSLTDLTGETVGTVRGYEYPTDFMKATNFKKDDATNVTQLLKKLQGDRFKVMILNELVGYAQIQKDAPELKNNIKVALEVGKDPMYIAFSKKSPNAVKLFAQSVKALKEMKEDGTIEKTLKKYSR